MHACELVLGWYLPAGQVTHWPASSYVPLSQSARKSAPLHDLPAAQAVHVCRVIDVPPAVKLPAEQRRQALAEVSPVYMLGAPQSRHTTSAVSVPPIRYWPRRHCFQASQLTCA